jgi:hypothetical protein
LQCKKIEIIHPVTTLRQTSWGYYFDQVHELIAYRLYNYNEELAKEKHWKHLAGKVQNET